VTSFDEPGERDRSHDETVARLRALATDGVPPRASALPGELYGAALRHFGSIARARRAAGLPETVPPRRRWTQATVLDELRRLHDLGLRIRDRDLRTAGHAGVAQAAQLLWGGLSRARRMAEISEVRRAARRREPWDPDRVISEIQRLHADRRPLASSKVDPRLYLAARRYFGAWGEAIDAAGLDYDRVRLHAPSYPAGHLLDQLRALAAAQPDLTASQLEDHPLAQILRRRFRSLPAAIRSAGLTAWPRLERRPVPTPEQTLAAIRARRDAGRSLLRREVRRDDGPLVRAAVRHFDSWQNALAAAG